MNFIEIKWNDTSVLVPEAWLDGLAEAGLIDHNSSFTGWIWISPNHQ